MKTIARILMGVAILALLGILAGIGYAFVRYGVNSKTVIGTFVALLALGGLIGRVILVARDSSKDSFRR